jgi:hypothetical protein
MLKSNYPGLTPVAFTWLAPFPHVESKLPRADARGFHAVDAFPQIENKLPPG